MLPTKGESGETDTVDAWDGILGVTGEIAAWAGVPGAAIAVGALKAARKANREAAGPSRSQAVVEDHEDRLARLEAAIGTEPSA